MMRRLKLLYAFLLLAVALPLLTACSSDDATGENHPKKDGKVTVRLRLSQAAPAMTRAGSDEDGLKDPNAAPEELMNVWTVVITDDAGNVKHILTGTPSDEHREIDPIETEIELTTGTTYKFYSFANIGNSNLETLLGFASGTITTPNPTGVMFPATGKTLDDYTAKVNGNFFDPSANDNGFGAQGIPMSNKQEITVTASTTVIDLIVVRMLAKMELRITNTGADDVTIESIILTDITQNANPEGSNDEGTANLKLFPSYKNSNNANTMDAVHGDIQPNLAEKAATDDLIITPSASGVTVVSDAPSDPSTPLIPLTIAKDQTKTITFYINESATPTDKNKFGRFYLKLNLSKGTDKTEQRYTLIDDKNATGQTGEWNYIARNDYRIIPISLGDYKVELIPYDFPAIAVYPASIKEEDGLNTITFHDYGHFHLQPKVTKFTASGIKIIPYSKTAETSGTWSLKGGTFDEAWQSWDDFGGTANNTGGFYRLESDPDYKEGEGDETGGEPAWWENTPSSPSDPSTPSNPRWASDWAPSKDNTIGYQPFIFGYIAAPKATGEERKVYHEFTIQINDGKSNPRLMTYRLYMILDENQMLPSSRRASGAPAARHTHGH